MNVKQKNQLRKVANDINVGILLHGDEITLLSPKPKHFKTIFNTIETLNLNIISENTFIANGNIITKFKVN